MHRKLTITIDDEVYQGLHQQVGRGRISQCIETLVREHILNGCELEDAYKAMAADEAREREALAWIEIAPDDAMEWDEAPYPTLATRYRNPS